MNGLWCKRCRWHKCRCMLAPIKRVTRDEFEKMYADDRPEKQWPPGSLTTVPHYTRTMTMDDLRRHALESVIEELKERDA